jgi:hypothetical protein
MSTAVEEIRRAAALMRAQQGEFWDALADWLDAEGRIFHRWSNSHHRGILGGYNYHCTCGRSYNDPDGDDFACATEALARELIRSDIHLPCTWGDDAWHRAVYRLIYLYRLDFWRLQAEERAKTGGRP